MPIRETNRTIGSIPQIGQFL